MASNGRTLEQVRREIEAERDQLADAVDHLRSEIEEVTDFHLMKEFIDKVFRKYLTPRERKILHLYYGLEQGSDAMTLEKIGALMGVTRERIRQIRERAFEKLRESPDGAALSGFWKTAD